MLFGFFPLEIMLYNFNMVILESSQGLVTAPLWWSPLLKECLTLYETEKVG